MLTLAFELRVTTRTGKTDSSLAPRNAQRCFAIRASKELIVLTHFSTMSSRTKPITNGINSFQIMEIFVATFY